MLQEGWAAGSLMLLPTLSFLAYFFAALWHNQPFSTRETPATVIRIAVGILFAGWVHPALGALAALQAYWWLRHGFTRLLGGTLWPTIALMWWLAMQAPAWAYSATLAFFLAAGVMQTLFAILQWRGWHLFPFPGYPVHGTIGHRTGLGIFLALLTPLAFATDYGWLLVGWYGAGIALSRSTVATGAMALGLLVANPGAWWLLPFSPLLALGRLIERHAPGTRLDGQLHLGRWALKSMFWSPPGRPADDTWALRAGIWRSTWRRSWTWPHWLLGHGARAFSHDARGWTASDGLREVYNEAHCDYLELGYDYGLLGLGLLAWAMVGLVGWPGGGAAAGVLVALAVAMAANFPISVTPLVAVAFFVLAWIARGLA